MGIYIFQIIGGTRYGRVRYTFSGDTELKLPKKEGVHIFSGMFMYDLFKEKGEEVRFYPIFPESLITAIPEITTPEEAIDAILEPEKFEKIMIEKFGDMFGADFNPVRCGSVGIYRSINRENSFTVKFDNGITNIITELFLLVLEKIAGDDPIDIKDESPRIFIDISTGLNIYTMALVEAARKSITFFRLRNILFEEDTTGPVLNIIFSTPIVGGITQASIEIYRTPVRAFFALPHPKFVSIKYSYINEKFGKSIWFSDYPNFKNDVEKFMEELTLMYNALNENIPLAFYDERLIKFPPDEHIRKLYNTYIKYIGEGCKTKLKESQEGKILYRERLNHMEVGNTLFSFALYINFRKLKFEEIGENPATLSSLKNVFVNLYERRNRFLGISEEFVLKKELRSIKEGLEKNMPSIIEKLKKKCLLLGYITGYENWSEPSPDKKEPDERNFFQHAGLPMDFTLLCMLNKELPDEQSINWNNLYVKWNSRLDMATIRKWLLGRDRNKKGSK